MNYFHDKFYIYVKKECDFDIFWHKYFFKLVFMTSELFFNI